MYLVKVNEARQNMIKQQIRTGKIVNNHILDVLVNTPREDFVPPQYVDLAFSDMNLPLENGEMMLTPWQEAMMIDTLNVGENDTVLEVGTGSAYTTALFSRLGTHVYSIAQNEGVKTAAQEKLSSHEIANVDLIVADVNAGLPDHAPYDVIAIIGGVPFLPPVYRDQLALGGRLFAIVGHAPVMQALRLTRVGEDEWEETNLFETAVAYLAGINQPEKFQF